MTPMELQKTWNEMIAFVDTASILTCWLGYVFGLSWEMQIWLAPTGFENSLSLSCCCYVWYPGYWAQTSEGMNLWMSVKKLLSLCLSWGGSTYCHNICLKFTLAHLKLKYNYDMYIILRCFDKISLSQSFANKYSVLGGHISKVHFNQCMKYETCYMKIYTRKIKRKHVPLSCYATFSDTTLNQYVCLHNGNTLVITESIVMLYKVKG